MNDLHTATRRHFLGHSTMWLGSAALATLFGQSSTHADPPTQNRLGLPHFSAACTARHLFDAIGRTITRRFV